MVIGVRRWLQFTGLSHAADAIMASPEESGGGGGVGRSWGRGRGGELGVSRVREHPLNMEVHPLTAKSTPSK